MSQSAKLWLIEAISMDDVVTVLEVRRRFEIPAAFTRACADDFVDKALYVLSKDCDLADFLKTP